MPLSRNPRNKRVAPRPRVVSGTTQHRKRLSASVRWTDFRSPARRIVRGGELRAPGAAPPHRGGSQQYVQRPGACRPRCYHGYAETNLARAANVQGVRGASAPSRPSTCRHSHTLRGTRGCCRAACSEPRSVAGSLRAFPWGASQRWKAVWCERSRNWGGRRLRPRPSVAHGFDTHRRDTVDPRLAARARAGIGAAASWPLECLCARLA